MKKIVILLLFLPFLLTGCKKKLTQFIVDYNASVTVSSTVGQLIPFSVVTPTITTNSEAEFEANNTAKKHVRSVHLTECTLTITSPSNETFSFLNSLEIYISADGLDEKKVCFKENIPSTVGNSITCDIVDLDLQEYIKSNTFKLRGVFTTDETIPEDVQINIYSRFLVDAKISKK